MLSPEDLTELETKYVRIAHLKGKGEPPPWEVVLRKPTRAEYKMYRSNMNNPAAKSDAQENMFRATCVFPPRGSPQDALLDDYPAIPEACGDAFANLLGLEVAIDLK